MNWHGKHYYSLDSFLKNTFGEKIYKVSLDGGFTCPNRDGTLGDRGCIFCSEGGSGDFASSAKLSIKDQISAGIDLVSHKNSSDKYIAYFQAYTNTYGPIDKMRRLFYDAITDDRIVGLDIGTRPDCLPDEVLALLSELNQIKPVFVELGLQTIHEESAKRIRRGYALPVFEDAVSKLSDLGILTVVHLILGLPGESKEMMLSSVTYLNSLPIHGVKLSLLHILKNTDLATLYESKPFYIFSFEEYIDMILISIRHLRKDIVIHRFTGDGPRDLVIAPRWSLHKRKILNEIAHQLKEQDLWQGDILK